MQSPKQPISALVRDHVREVYLRPAVQRGETVVTVNVGGVHKALALGNRVPLVLCRAQVTQVS